MSLKGCVCTVNASVPNKSSHRNLSFRCIPSWQRLPTKESCLSQNMPQPSHMKRKDHFCTYSNWCLWNVVRFSITRGTRRGDSVRTSNFFPELNIRQRRSLSDIEVGRVWATLSKCLTYYCKHLMHTTPKSYRILYTMVYVLRSILLNVSSYFMKHIAQSRIRF